MSLFRPQPKSTESRVASLSAAELILLDRYGGRTNASGVPVNDDTSMRLAAVWGCVDLISEIVSTLPVSEYRDTGPAGTPQRQDPPTLLTDPGGDFYGFEVWSRAALTSLLLRGNLYGLITSLDDRAHPQTIKLLHPDRVTYGADGFWRLDGEIIDRYPNGSAQLWHVPAYSVAGTPLGLSPISYAAQTIGLGIASQRFGAQWFGDGAHPTSMLTSDAPVASPEDAQLVKQRVMDATRGSREPLVLGGGWKMEAIQVAPEESQFLETIKANADDVAKFFFRRPPGEGGQVTYANVEARSLDLLTYTINGWLVRLERALTRLRPRGRYVKFNADALIRVDTETRYKAHTEAIRGGWSTPDERRRLEDLGPRGSDDLLWPPYSTSVAPEAPPDGTEMPDAQP